MALTVSNNQLSHGTTAPDFSLRGTDGRNYSLSEFPGPKLVVFMCNHCPYVKPKIQELIRIQKDFSKQGLTVIGINSNDDKEYPEDSFENMITAVQAYGINFPYLRDDTQDVAKAYGAVCTPDPFLFDKNNKLVYHGRIDDSHGNGPVQNHEMYHAVSMLIKQGKVDLNEQPSMGCSIKWKNSY